MTCCHSKENTNRSSKTCITSVPIFSELSEDEIYEIDKITKKKEFEKGEMIFLSGDRLNELYVINKGQVKISRISDEGKEQIIRILGNGDFIGELSIFTNSSSKNNAEVIQGATVCVIEGEKLKDIICNHPRISIKILEELSKRIEKSDNLIEQLSLYDVEQRIVDMLLNMTNVNNLIVLSTSKKDLAAHIGISQETLSRKLSYFQNKGWIKLEGQRKIYITDKEGLINR